MPVYAIAQLTIVDRARYAAYAARFLDTLRPHAGRLLAADESPVSIEGSWPHDKLVLLEFRDPAAFRAWLTSPAYQAIVADRHASTIGTVLLVDGVSR